MVQTTIFLPCARAPVSSALLLPGLIPLRPVTTATTPVVRWKSKTASWSWAPSRVRSEITSTMSKTLLSAESCRSAKKWAVQAMVLVLPEPAECWIRYLPPAPSSRTAARSLRVASSWWKRGKMSLSICFLLSRWAMR